MMLIREIAAFLFFISALVFGTGGIVGLFRFPDPYARLQAGSLCGTTAVFSIFLGALCLASSWAMAARIIIISIFFLVSAPTGSHIVARFAWNSGLEPWRPPQARRSGSKSAEANSSGRRPGRARGD